MTTSTLMRVLTMAAAPMMLGAQVPAPRPEPAPPPKKVRPAVPAVPVLADPVLAPEPVLATLAGVHIDLKHELDLAEISHESVLSSMAVAHVKLVAEDAKFAVEDAKFALEDSEFEDPADSLYRLARESLNRGEYRRAAQIFNEVTRKYPSSKYAVDCAYWEAFSRYRLGTTDELKAALQILDGKGVVALSAEAMARQGRPGSSTAIDIPALRARVQGALAARGDREAAAALQKEARQSTGCDREEVGVRAEALQALAQMDMQAALPVVKKVLQRREECTVELRRRALYLLGRQPDAEAAALVLDAAKNDPDETIRGEAMRVLPRIAGDSAVTQLEDLLRTSTDERSQRSAVNALASIDNERARRAVRTIIERNDAAERVRYEAILALAREREDRSPATDDMTYLRSLYPRLESPRLREAVLTAVGRVENADNQQFLLGIARNEKEATSVRATALERIGRMESISVNEIAKLYDSADARSLRERILYSLSQRKEPEAIDKMMEIAKRDTDPQIRRTAINLLGRSNNERAKQLLKELIEK